LQEESDGPPPSPKKTDVAESKKDKSLQNLLLCCLFLNLFIMDLSFKGPIKMDILFVLVKNASLIGEENMRLMMIIYHVG
jgi:hypothetical protein